MLSKKIGAAKEIKKKENIFSNPQLNIEAISIHSSYWFSSSKT